MLSTSWRGAGMWGGPLIQITPLFALATVLINTSVRVRGRASLLRIAAAVAAVVSASVILVVGLVVALAIDMQDEVLILPVLGAVLFATLAIRRGQVKVASILSWVAVGVGIIAALRSFAHVGMIYRWHEWAYLSRVRDCLVPAWTRNGAISCSSAIAATAILLTTRNRLKLAVIGSWLGATLAISAALFSIASVLALYWHISLLGLRYDRVDPSDVRDFLTSWAWMRSVATPSIATGVAIWVLALVRTRVHKSDNPQRTPSL